ncbi:MAG TPA: hypothetical protein VN778_02005 [Verrucomicrobiae bacterium]|nr:hypothetical protein [Verrucomicrobiae bacterium]
MTQDIAKTDRITSGEYAQWSLEHDTEPGDEGAGWAPYNGILERALTEAGITPPELAEHALDALDDPRVREHAHELVEAGDADLEPVHRLEARSVRDRELFMARWLVSSNFLALTGLRFGKRHPDFQRELEIALLLNGVMPTDNEIRSNIIRVQQ